MNKELTYVHINNNFNKNTDIILNHYFSKNSLNSYKNIIIKDSYDKLNDIHHLILKLNKVFQKTGSSLYFISFLNKKMKEEDLKILLNYLKLKISLKKSRFLKLNLILVDEDKTHNLKIEYCKLLKDYYFVLNIY